MGVKKKCFWKIKEKKSTPKYQTRPGNSKGKNRNAEHKSYGKQNAQTMRKFTKKGSVKHYRK